MWRGATEKMGANMKPEFSLGSTLRVKEASGFDELFDIVREATQQLKHEAARLNIAASDDPAETIWYRGVPRQEFGLIPSLLRFDKGFQHERDLYERFLEHRSGFVENSIPCKHGWDALFEMQHYFIPTRLLDWSSSFGVALHFALHGDVPRKKPCIWILHPGILNRKASDKGPHQIPSSALSRSDLDTLISYEQYLREKTTINKLPIAMIPEAIFPRLRAQRGRFTIHGEEKAGIETLCPEAVQAIYLDDTAIDNIKDRVKMLGVDSISMFPDHAGLADFLKRRYSLTKISESATLASQIRSVWHDVHSLLALTSSGHRSPGSVAIPGIENCAVSSDFIARDDDRAQLADFEQWLVNSREGSVHFVTGKAGSGKTNYILNLILSHKLYDSNTVIWFPLFRFDRKKALLENLCQTPYATNDNPSVRTAISELLSRSDTILILDGLDELSKLQGREAAADLWQAVQQQRKDSSSPKVVIVCRDDIFANLNKEIFGAGSECIHRLSKLSHEGVLERYPGTHESTIELLMEFPIFIRLLDGKQPDPFPENAAKLFLFIISNQMADWQGGLQRLGQLAQRMLDNRRDYLKDNEFRDFPASMDSFLTRPRFLIKEKNGDIRFLHHNVREFVLGWNVRDALIGNNTAATNMLASTCNLDYVGVEIFRAVSELGGVPEWNKAKKTWSTLPARSSSKNNFAWGAFESAGDLGIASHHQRDDVIAWILELLDRPIDGRDRDVSFQTKYNAVRCLERLHPSAPSEYWRWITQYWRNTGSSASGRPTLIYGYAVRGFQRPILEVHTTPPMWFPDQESRIGYRDKLQKEISSLLLRKIHQFSEFAEITDNARYLLVNMSHAIIRWFDPESGFEDCRELDELLRHLDEDSRKNLCLARWYWLDPALNGTGVTKKIAQDGVLHVYA
jgi:hypothetical protein